MALTKTAKVVVSADNAMPICQFATHYRKSVDVTTATVSLCQRPLHKFFHKNAALHTSRSVSPQTTLLLLYADHPDKHSLPLVTAHKPPTHVQKYEITAKKIKKHHCHQFSSMSADESLIDAPNFDNRALPLSAHRLCLTYKSR